MSAALQIPPPGDLTIPKFLEWSATADGLWQLRDGEPEPVNPPAETHGAIQVALGALLYNHLERAGSACRVVSNGGVVPRLRSDWNMLVPDLAVTCAPPADRQAAAEPILLVEISSTADRFVQLPLILRAPACTSNRVVAVV